MLRTRFTVAVEDPRPLKWPIKHPYWITGQGDGYYILVTYADGEAQILELWPEAEILESEEVQGYEFSDRFPRPHWM